LDQYDDPLLHENVTRQTDQYIVLPDFSGVYGLHW